MSDMPEVSIGLAVRNAEREVARCIESVLAQDFDDLELIVCDNASDDQTVSIVEQLAGSDPRVRLHVNESNVGSQANMNRAFDLSRGRHFRWISSDDWLEPSCLSAGVQALESEPDAIGATSWFTIHTVDGLTRYEDYAGEFPTSPDAARRFERMLWFFHAGDAKYDPMYALYRRDGLMRSHRLRSFERTDWLLSAELALMGPIIHVYERLAHRTRDYPVGSQRVALRRRLDPVRAKQLPTPPRRLSRELFALALAADLSHEQLRRCRHALLSFWAKEVARVSRSRAADIKHQLLACCTAAGSGA